MKPLFPVAAAAALLAALSGTPARAACYVVYGPAQDIIYRAPEPPVDMSRHIHETLPWLVPGATMVFTPDDFGCEFTINKLPLTAAGADAWPPAPGARVPRRDRG